MWVRLGSIMLMVSFQAQFVGQPLHLLSLSISEPTDGFRFVLSGPLNVVAALWQTWCYVEALTLKLMSWVWFLLKHINKAMTNNTCCISDCCAERFSTQMSTFGWTDQKLSVKVQSRCDLTTHFLSHYSRRRLIMTKYFTEMSNRIKWYSKRPKVDFAVTSLCFLCSYLRECSYFAETAIFAAL